MKKMAVLLFSLFLLVSCTNVDNYSPVIHFDSQKFTSSKALWSDNEIDSYSFSYSVTSDAGILIEAQVSVVNDISNITIKKINNKVFSEFPDGKFDEEISAYKEEGYYLTNIDDVFSCVDKIYKSNQKMVQKYSEKIRSVTLSVKYSNNGIPVFIETVWDTKEKLVGLDGPIISITDLNITI